MSGRRVLIIGSQCRRFNRLSFLPEVAVRFHALMTDPGPGACLGAEVCDPPGLLLDPTVDEAREAIKETYEAAAHYKETLILAYVGHGEFARGDFFLMPTDATNSGDALHLAQLIKHRPVHPDGLIVLLDTCYSGTGAYDAVESWCRALEGQLRFEVLTATDDRPTANAWFTRSLIRLLERGDPMAPDQLRCEDARAWVMRDHPQIRPQHSAHNPSNHLRFGRNNSKVPGDVFWRESPGRIQILERTAYFQPTARLAEIVQASEAHRSVLLMGETGAGKSSLAAALARPEITKGQVQPGFVHAVGMLGITTNLRNLAVDLDHQLRRSVAGFTEAVEEFHRTVPPNDREKLDLLNGMVLQPLHYLEGRPVVRIALDGLDQLSDHTRRRLRDELGQSPDHLRLIMTARDDTPDCPDAHVVHTHRTDHAVLNRYMEERGIPKDAREAILNRAEGHWLITQLLADAVLEQPDLDLARLPRTVNEAYALRLDQARAEADWRNGFRPVLGPLAVAGAGPVLPLVLLVHASAALGGPSDDRGVLQILGTLRGLVARRDPDDPDGHTGLFHTTLAEYLLSPEAAFGGYAIDTAGARRALAEAIDALAPATGNQPDDALHRYAFLYEAELWWVLGEIDRTLTCLLQRQSYSARENLDRLTSWLPSIQDLLVSDHLITLSIRSAIASWTGRAGDAREALHLFTQLQPEAERVHGPDHVNTLTNRNNIAMWTRETGNLNRALQLFEELLSDRERILGSDHPHTLLTRGQIASLTGLLGKRREALRLFTALLPDKQRILGADHPDTLLTRNNIAFWTAQTGDIKQAFHLSTTLVLDQERVLGAYHHETLRTLRNIAHWTGMLGDVRAAIRAHVFLLHKHFRVLGKYNPYTMRLRSNLAHWINRGGNVKRALRLYTALLPYRERLLGEDHPDTLVLRNNIAECTAMTGDVEKALELFIALLKVQKRVLGADHPSTLNTRRNLVSWICEGGNVEEAAHLLGPLLSDYERVLELDHPDTLEVLFQLGVYRARSGEQAMGCRMLREGLARTEARFGPAHPLAEKFRDAIRSLGCSGF